MPFILLVYKALVLAAFVKLYFYCIQYFWLNCRWYQMLPLVHLGP